MTKLTADVKEALANQKVASLVTADKNGVPNVALMGFVRAMDDETIIMANVFWKKTEANLKENPKAALSAYMPPKAYQIKGTVELIDKGPLMDEVAEWVTSKMANLKPKGAAILHVEEIYSMMPGPSAGERIS
jgi:predicted pyridoxine 5'-phosphate oxidase superfamily flavin-nucleotide-binding protein